MRHLNARVGAIGAGALLVGTAVATLSALATVTWVATGLQGPGAIDFQPLRDAVIAITSGTGNAGAGLELVTLDGIRFRVRVPAGWSGVPALAIAKGAAIGFDEGDMFVAPTGGAIVRVPPAGTSAPAAWARLPGNRGEVTALHFDRTGVFGGDLLAATTDGTLWRISADGLSTLITSTGRPLQAVVVVPRAERYGSWGGIALAAAAAPGCQLLAISPTGSFTESDPGICASDLDLVIPNVDLYATALVRNEEKVSGAVMKIAAPELAGVACDVLAAGTEGALFTLSAQDGRALPLTGSVQGLQVRAVTFADAANACQPEVCGDGEDNNDNGEVDEGCKELCGDGVDNDSDGEIDNGCAEICGNGVDDDGNGVTDDRCVEVCGDLLDNDGDDVVDVPCPEACGDKIDNDANGEIDDGCPPPAVQAGCTPAQWLQSPSQWRGFKPDDRVGTIVTIPTGQPWTSIADQTARSVLQAEPAGVADPASRRMWSLVRATLSGLLSAASPAVGYPLSPAHLREQATGAIASGNALRIEALTSVLEAYNNLSCPIRRDQRPRHTP